MKRLIVLFSFVFLFSLIVFSFASESNTDVNIENPGCDLRGEIAGEFLVPGGCSEDGKWSCQDRLGYDLESYDTLNDNLGCSYGKDSLEEGVNFCCPDGYYCQEDSGQIGCVERLTSCSGFDNRDDCLETSCYWFGQTDTQGICVNSVKEIGCNDYAQEDSCNEDDAGIGQNGIGTNICGSEVTIDGVLYIVPEDSCRCEWEATEESTCEFVYDLRPSIWQGTPNSFDCAKEFSVGECEEGEQIISWTANVIEESITGDKFLLGILQEDLEAAECIDGSETRICGEATLKLPGFSLLAAFLSLILIVIIYFLRGDIFVFRK